MTDEQLRIANIRLCCWCESPSFLVKLLKLRDNGRLPEPEYICEECYADNGGDLEDGDA